MALSVKSEAGGCKVQGTGEVFGSNEVVKRRNQTQVAAVFDSGSVISGCSYLLVAYILSLGRLGTEPVFVFILPDASVLQDPRKHLLLD